ncbi:hypothetical protein Fbal_1740 [Ferrimonas balearica DSM 9799]|uniref:Uncharacterized protein n=1 Tax=Ferrimonas balearica (strain DSM 9799 / CCM 4581 / KCTC 23876 / PAT) TaxID=550540 RepID=E1SRJ3_FERBD|nr:hypothetical protein [Ferrimonas balearica]ADN75944.1 hypothetical protein Fbal_1740 [Ferrimonas balearica DSM 9799]MBY6016413.1 hypothetical protein [Halomonas denitrificans]
MRWLPLVALLIGCSARTPPVPEVSVTPLADLRGPMSVVERLSDDLNEGDQSALRMAIQPDHPLAQWEPELLNDPAWRELVDQWVEELVMHAGTGQWQFRQLVTVGSGWRAEYRLVHENFAVEYFYFDIGDGPQGLRIEDMGNHLFQMSQVQLMDHLYHQLMREYGEAEQPFNHFFSYLQPYGEGEVDKSVFVKAYRQLPKEIQANSLTRELVLRALSGNESQWYSGLPSNMVHRLYGDDYRLMQTNTCLSDLDADCRGIFERLPATLRNDVAMQTEMGIRALHRGELERAGAYADAALADSDDYLPTFWLSLQVALGEDDHSSAIASLDRLSRQFDLPLDKTILFEVYPAAGERLLASSDFTQWAQRVQEEEAQ